MSDYTDSNFAADRTCQLRLRPQQLTTPSYTLGHQHQTSFSQKVLITEDLIRCSRFRIPLRKALKSLLPSAPSTTDAFDCIVIYPSSSWMSSGIRLLYAVLFSADLVPRHYILRAETVKRCLQIRLNNHLWLGGVDTTHGQPKVWKESSSAFLTDPCTQMTPPGGVTEIQLVSRNRSYRL